MTLLTYVYFQGFVAIQLETLSPFPLRRFEQMSTLLFCSAQDKTMSYDMLHLHIFLFKEVTDLFSDRRKTTYADIKDSNICTH